jgi:transposase
MQVPFHGPERNHRHSSPSYVRNTKENKAARALCKDGGNRFWFEWLPDCAPDLNPVEKLWGHTKHDDLANYIPDDLLDLELALEGSFAQTRRRPALLRSFYHGAKLDI